MRHIADDDFDLAGYVAGIMAARPAHDAVREPMRLDVYATPTGHAAARVVGHCAAGCAHGYTSEVHDGYSRAVRCQSCADMRRRADLFTAAGLPEWVAGIRQGWRTVNGAPPLDAASALARSFMARSELGRIWHGDPGRGKSYRAAAVACAAIDAGMSVRWVHWPTVLSELRDRLREDLPIGDFQERLLRVALLVVDEVAGRSTEFTGEVAESVLGRRAERKLPIAVTTNLTMAKLQAYVGDRVWSRISALGVVEVTGIDLRSMGKDGP